MNGLGFINWQRHNGPGVIWWGGRASTIDIDNRNATGNPSFARTATGNPSFARSATGRPGSTQSRTGRPPNA